MIEFRCASRLLGTHGQRDAIVIQTPTSSATTTFTPAGNHRWATTQRGPARLWDTVEAARRSWERLGKPSRTRLGISALDDPRRQVRLARRSRRPLRMAHVTVRTQLLAYTRGTRAPDHEQLQQLAKRASLDQR